MDQFLMRNRIFSLLSDYVTHVKIKDNFGSIVIPVYLIHGIDNMLIFLFLLIYQLLEKHLR